MGDYNQADEQRANRYSDVCNVAANIRFAAHRIYFAVHPLQAWHQPQHQPQP